MVSIMETVLSPRTRRSTLLNESVGFRYHAIPVEAEVHPNA